MSDLISRQAAIDAVGRFRNIDGISVWHNGIKESIRIAIIEDLAKLPSAEPPYQYSAAYVTQLRGERDILQDMVNNVAERPTGHIVTKCSGKFNPTVWAECSDCGKPIDPWDKFCRHCGAKMEESHE